MKGGRQGERDKETDRSRTDRQTDRQTPRQRAKGERERETGYETDLTVCLLQVIKSHKVECKNRQNQTYNAWMQTEKFGLG